MENISAACAMGWSIDLEKGLRSKNPDCLVESIRQIGLRLNRWNEESQLTITMCNIFGLVLGEDRLFADAILLRLADAFVSGDKVIKTCIMKVFLSIHKCYKTKGGQTHGIFSKMSLTNRLEFLKRVKVVLCAECVEYKALTLILLGCCADIAKDNVEIRYAILCSLFSSDILEAKASLFAAGCFSEVSDDFGYVFLHRLMNLVTSSKTSSSLKVGGARAFSKIECSSLLAIKSYKVGVELATKVSEEDILVTLLISLTKLSSKVGILVPEQVALLTSYIEQKTSFLMQSTVLRCLYYIGNTAGCFLPVGAFPFQPLFKLFDESNVPSSFRCDSLKILLKMTAYGLPVMPDINEFMKLMRYVEDATRSLSLSERLLAFKVIVHMFIKLKGRSDVILEGNSISSLSRLVSALCDQLLNPLFGDTEKTETEQELRSILDLLLVLVKHHSDSGYLVLDKLHCVIENIVNSFNAATIASLHKVMNAGAEENKVAIQKFMFYIFRFLNTFLEISDEAFRTSDQVVSKLKHTVSFVCGNCMFGCSIHTFYAIFLHSNVKFGCLLSENKDICASVEAKGKSSPCKMLGCEVLIHEYVGKMVSGGDRWAAYRAGRYAFSEGLPYLANFIFQQLETKVQSDICCQWLKLLVQFTHFEEIVRLSLEQACHAWISNPVLKPHVVNNDKKDTSSSGYIKKLVDACGNISASNKMLEAISIQTQTLCFQRWFLDLRVKLVHVVVDIFKLLDTFLSCKDTVASTVLIRGSDVSNNCPSYQNFGSMMSSIVGISSQFARLAEEFDLIASSFFDMDSQSLSVIAVLAFSCSLLAFCAEYINPTEQSSVWRHVVMDLVGRLWHADPETCDNLMSLLKEHELHGSLWPSLSRFKISRTGCISEELFTVCRESVKEIIELQKKRSDYNDGVLPVGKDSLQHLLNVLVAWMHMPFRVPKYFFRVRPSIGSVLICSSTGCGKPNELSVSLGSHLPLNLCIQLKNMPYNASSSFSKIYGILSCKTSFLVTPNTGLSGATMTGYDTSKTEMMVTLNKKLQCYVRRQTKEFLRCRDWQSDSGSEVEVCVSFEMNGRGQGFSTCLLDVSGFPVGSYRVQWHCGGVDREGNFCSILPLRPGPVFCVKQSSSIW